MHIMIVGSGLMGPAAAYRALIDPSVDRITLVDRDEEALAQARGVIDRALDYRDVHHWREKGEDLRTGDKALLLRAEHPARYPLETIIVDLEDPKAASTVFADADVILCALPWGATRLAVRAALDAGVPLVDLSIPDDEEMAELARETKRAKGFILLGCGLEPGLTEIEARRLAGRFDRVDSVHIMVGGVPSEPSGRLGYRIVFGGRKLPLRDVPAMVVRQGRRVDAPRYSDVESAAFAGVGKLEAWQEGVIPWMLDRPELKGVADVSQKTIRWPGYAHYARALNDLGLLDTEPIDVDGTSVAPKDLVDAVLRPDVTFGPDDRDITLFRVELRGIIGGEEKTWRTEFIDRFDEKTGFTSMARTTAFTGAIIARMIADGTIAGTGLRTPDELLHPDALEKLYAELRKDGIRFRSECYASVEKYLKDGRIVVDTTSDTELARAWDWIATFFDPEEKYDEYAMLETIDALQGFEASPEVLQRMTDGGWFSFYPESGVYRRQKE